MDDEDEEEDFLDWEPDARITTSASRSSEDHGEGHSDTSTESRNARNRNEHGSMLSPPRQVERPQNGRAITLAAVAFPTGLRSDHSSNPGLDYALIPIRFMSPSGRDPDQKPNAIYLQDGTHQITLEIQPVADIPAQEGHIIAVTGSRGVAHGLLIPSALYFRNATLRQF
jgi:hypothetical protein